MGNKIQANSAYNMINMKANGNSIIQGLSGILGFPFTIAADVAVIPTIYLPVVNDVRGIFGHEKINMTELSSILPKIMSEILADLVLDKFMGNIPILGIYFNAICAKTMTWRIGTLFSFLSSRGAEIPVEQVQEVMELIRHLFPQKEMFRFKTPDNDLFCSLVSSVKGEHITEFSHKVTDALSILRGREEKDESHRIT